MRWLAALLLTGTATPAFAQAVDTSKCATVGVTKATVADIPKLQADADCFGSAAAADKAQSDALLKAAAAARASQKYRLDRIAALKSAPPPPPPAPQPAAATGPSDTISGMPPIKSEFDFNLGLKPSWGTGAIPKSAAPDVVGAYRIDCGGDGQLLPDDPIVYPGQPGKSHLHQFYGNTGANAASTYESLRKSGLSTCAYGQNPLNRSSYWLPAMLDGKGHVIRPDYVTVYYKRRPLSDPKCSLTSGDPKAIGNCVPTPHGLKIIYGWNMAKPSEARTVGKFHCVTNNVPSQPYASLTDLAAAGCPVGSKVLETLTAPSCWDGRNLDSADHRSHMAYPDYGNWGYEKCDLAHPFVVPRYEIKPFYSVEAGDDLSLWSLSSDMSAPGKPKGFTLHGDSFYAWDPDAEAMMIAGCIDNFLNCSGGDFGNGLQMKGAAKPPYGWKIPQRLVPMPPMPGM